MYSCSRVHLGSRGEENLLWWELYFEPMHSPGCGCAGPPAAGRSLAGVSVPVAPPAGAGEIPGKGQNPARQKQKLSPVTHNWWNICSNFFSLPLRLGSSAACQEAAVPVRLARLVERGLRCCCCCRNWFRTVGTCWSRCCGPQALGLPTFP